HLPVLDQMIVEMNLLAVVRDQLQVGKMPLTNQFPRRDVLPVPERRSVRRIRTQTGDDSGRCCSSQERSSLYVCHDFSPFSMVVCRVPFSPYGEVLLSPTS